MSNICQKSVILTDGNRLRRVDPAPPGGSAKLAPPGAKIEAVSDSTGRLTLLLIPEVAHFANNRRGAADVHRDTVPIGRTFGDIRRESWPEAIQRNWTANLFRNKIERRQTKRYRLQGGRHQNYIFHASRNRTLFSEEPG